jgi:hypothetical protein
VEEQQVKMISWRAMEMAWWTLEDSWLASSSSWESVSQPQSKTQSSQAPAKAHYQDGRTVSGNCKNVKRWLFAYVALPTLLWHSAQIAGGAAAMSVFGGLLIYATIISFTLFFQEQEDFWLAGGTE